MFSKAHFYLLVRNYQIKCAYTIRKTNKTQHRVLIFVSNSCCSEKRTRRIWYNSRWRLVWRQVCKVFLLFLFLTYRYILARCNWHGCIGVVLFLNALFFLKICYQCDFWSDIIIFNKIQIKEILVLWHFQKNRQKNELSFD